MIRLKGITKSYRRGAETVWALRGIDLEVNRGDFIAITGESGSGKTTLLNIMGLLDKPTEGTIAFDDIVVNTFKDKRLTQLRRQKIGFVFQHFYLIPKLSVIQNVKLPLLFSGRQVMQDKIQKILEIVGLKDRQSHSPEELSGGQMQRVAIARALVNDPEVILADEPTGNLDSQNSQKIIELFSNLNKMGVSIVIITHNMQIANIAHRVIKLSDGLIV